MTEDKKVRNTNGKAGRYFFVTMIALLLSLIFRFNVIEVNNYTKEEYNNIQNQYTELLKNKENKEKELYNLEGLKRSLENYIE